MRATDARRFVSGGEARSGYCSLVRPWSTFCRCGMRLLGGSWVLDSGMISRVRFCRLCSADTRGDWRGWSGCIRWPTKAYKRREHVSTDLEWKKETGIEQSMIVVMMLVIPNISARLGSSADSRPNSPFQPHLSAAFFLCFRRIAAPLISLGYRLASFPLLAHRFSRPAACFPGRRFCQEPWPPHPVHAEFPRRPP